MKILVSGAQFANKGAQSLLYSVMSELSTRYKDAEIYYIPVDKYKKYDRDKYRFIVTYDDKAYRDRKGDLKKHLKLFSSNVKNSFEISFKPKYKGIKKYSKIIKEIDVLIDVSGFALTDKFPNSVNRRFLRYIEDAKKHGAKVILMPQSFGPFEYKTQKEQLCSDIKRIMPKADLIFAREQEGKAFLEDQFGIRNVKLSLDTVLQADELRKEAVFTGKPEVNTPVVKTERNVGIVPNKQTIHHGDEAEVLRKYRAIIKQLLSYDRNVYIFNHSDDISLCEKIYSMFGDNDRVHLIKKEMDCIEYSEFVRNFDYIIASRYHAIVHAFKEHVPAVILGWAVKYFELAAAFSQDKYVYDLNSCKAEEAANAIDTMEKHFADEHRVIKEKCRMTSQDSCFDKCWSIIDKINMQ